MRLELYDFRHAVAVLEGSHAGEWAELRAQLEQIGEADVSSRHRDYVRTAYARGRRPQAGAQTALNDVIDSLLVGSGWTRQPPLYSGADKRGHKLAGWKMDFRKGRVGVEVAFNHQEAIPWIFTRLDLAAESDEVLPSARIDVGVAAFAAASLKSWGKMDGVVGTFDQACLWLDKMRPVIPVPLVVVGLHAADPDGSAWPASDAFRGTRKGRAYGKVIELPEWYVAEQQAKGSGAPPDR